MENYNMSAKEAENMARKMVQDRMEELGISAYRLSQLIDLNETTLLRWLAGESRTHLESFFKICGALDINPQFVMKEDDDRKYTYHHFN